MKLKLLPLLAVTLQCFATAGYAAQLVLAGNGRSDYQVVVPDESATLLIGQLLLETGQLVQRAFAAGGFPLEVVSEAGRDPARPAIYLGDTRFARTAGIDPSGFEGWSYAHRVVGSDLLIAGCDAPHPVERDARGNQMGARMGTIKGVADFLRLYARTRFLYPDGDTGVEFLPVTEITVPADLDVVITPSLRFNFYGRLGDRGVTSLSSGLYLVANNYFPNVSFIQQPHTYPRAVPVARYRESHPEYFALFGDRRTVEFLPVERMGHYCVSNPEVQELIYQDMLQQVDAGYEMAVLGQQDGFQPCQCENCRDLYGTDDWGEKLWFFHLGLARRFQADRPGRKVITLIYGPTRLPPASVRVFPENLMMRMRLESVEQLGPWSGISLPGGIFGALGIWGASSPAGFTPQRTPLNVAALAKQYHEAGLKGFYLDGFGHLFGLEGPTYYVFGRMFDDPGNLDVKDLLEEYYEAAFRETQAPMRRFFEILHQAVQLSLDLPAGYLDEYGRTRNFRMTPLKRMRLVYPPDVLSELEAALGQAETLAVSPKVKSRLALVRYEFDYARRIAVIAHLHEAYLVSPDSALRDHLLDAVDERNAYLDTLFSDRGSARAGLVPGWPEYRLFTGYSRNTVFLPRQYSETPLAWDTAQMRAAPMPGAKRLNALVSEGPVALDASDWERAEGEIFAPMPGVDGGIARKTTVRAIAGPEYFYLRLESELPLTGAEPAPVTGIAAAAGRETLEIVLDPFGRREQFYRFIVGPGGSDSRSSGATGFIADPLHPLFGREDPAWSGDWRYETRLDQAGNRWLAMVSVPYETLGVPPPEIVTVWRGNFGRTHPAAPGRIERSIWSANPETRNVLDPGAFGEIAFGAPAAESQVEAAQTRQRLRRLMFYDTIFEIPDEWRDLPDRLADPWDTWLFRADPADRGVEDGWYQAGFDDGDWLPVEVPAFWRETAAGDYLGHAWYRVRFNLPAAWRGRPVRLSFGSIDGQAWIYLNEALVRERSEATEGVQVGQFWNLPFTAEIPSVRLRYGDDPNIMAVRVEKARGNAGIWRPVLINAAGPVQ